MRPKRTIDEDGIIKDFIEENIPENIRKELSPNFRKAVVILGLKPKADVSSLIKEEEIPLAKDIARRFNNAIARSLPKRPTILTMERSGRRRRNEKRY